MQSLPYLQSDTGENCWDLLNPNSNNHTCTNSVPSTMDLASSLRYIRIQIYSSPFDTTALPADINSTCININAAGASCLIRPSNASSHNAMASVGADLSSLKWLLQFNNRQSNLALQSTASRQASSSSVSTTSGMRFILTCSHSVLFFTNNFQCIAPTASAPVPTSANINNSAALIAGLSVGIIGAFIIGGAVVFQTIRRRRRQKGIIDNVAGSNCHTTQELDRYISTALISLQTEHLLRSQIAPSKSEVRELLDLDFTVSERSST